MLLEPLEPRELAVLLTHLEHRGFNRLRLSDIRAFARSAGTSCSAPLRRLLSDIRAFARSAGTSCSAPLRRLLSDIRAFARSAGTSCSSSLRRLVALSNGLSRWVQLRVLRPLAAAQRAAALGQCLHLAQSLLELRNFNSLLAVVGGLGHGSIARLRRTLGLLSPPLIQMWAQLAEAVGSGGNYRGYRALLGGAGGSGGFRVPALGVHLRDLVALEAALPDWGGPGRPHPNKLRARFALQGALLAGREQGPPGTPHPDLLRLLEVSLALGPSEQQLHQMSLQREPRESAPAGPPPELPPALPPERWVLPEPPRPDPEGLRPRLEQLVESIFRNFDVDGDGRISGEEFGIVRENFPHLPPLGELDTDRDGGLSRGEVLDYFLRCSQGAPPGPPHQFRALRGLRGGPCESCGKMIWGLNKDGMECSGCGLRAHPSCREFLPPECRRRPPGPLPKFSRPRTQSVAAAGTPPEPPGPLPKSRPRSFSLSLAWPRRASLPPPPDPPAEGQDGVFDTHL
ncbi:RAS guanyl-releasing protein 2-like [Catharus ustulatus]|uniref:RAS guanyl-releasing protein 2-like n=1 Tax=Catharus ustulatus TaxID=91951 RepID=UPI00140ABAB0|nr:RAS guanyl-releasing protein 2-like [Catharus ustulatus]